MVNCLILLLVISVTLFICLIKLLLFEYGNTKYYLSKIIAILAFMGLILIFINIMKINCKKVKLDKIGAMLIVANARKRTQKNFLRKEKRVYFCHQCKAYHTTSRK